jgi:GTP diphosphokinase / guanosine-3',5'-bis(diphosphate) 3'-diphosphatase
MLVADATDGSDTNLVIAALLHDAIEDCEVPRELIAESFGEDVAAIVEEVTDDKSLRKAVRKGEQIKTSSTKSPKGQVAETRRQGEQSSRSRGKRTRRMVG